MPAMRHVAERGAVLAGHQAPAFFAGQPLARWAHQIGGGILHADNVGDLRQARHRLDRNLHDRPAGDIVENDRNIDRFGDGRVVAIKPFLRRLVVIAGDGKHGVRADIFRVFGQRQCFGGRVRPRARDDRHAAVRFLDTHLHNAHVLFMAERGRFARGPAGHQPMGTFRDLPCHQLAKCRLVHLSALHGRNQGRDGTSYSFAHIAHSTHRSNNRRQNTAHYARQARQDRWHGRQAASMLSPFGI